MPLKTACLIVSLVISLSSFGGEKKSLSKDDPQDVFPIPDTLRDRVNFWIKIYSEVTTNQGYLHDANDPSKIYTLIDFKDRNHKERKQYLKRETQKCRDILEKLAYNLPQTDEEKSIFKLFGDENSRGRFLEASENVRFQLGQSDRFKIGVIRSGAYLGEMKKIFTEMDVPVDLTYLPNVESSFNVKAYSKFGAAGIWQFTRGTGRKYLKINNAIDERLDPIKATYAAAKLLKYNYSETQSWPLAITAYNHGLGGMLRAIRQLGTKDISKIIKEYEGRVFGFASQNFYCEFLAAREVYSNYGKHFGKLELDPPWQYDIFGIKNYMDIRTLAKHLDLPIETIKKYNLSLRPAVLKSYQLIPKGFALKVPIKETKILEERYASIPPASKFEKQKETAWYQIRKGDNLTKIAEKYGVNVSDIIKLNAIDPHHILAGRTIKIPATTLLAAAQGENAPQKTQFITEKKSKPTEKEIITTLNKPKSKKVIRIEKPKPTAVKKEKEYLDHINIEPDETLGHIADWLNISETKLRALNSLSFRSTVRLNQKIKITYQNVSKEDFNNIRNEYHSGIEEDFYLNFKIVGTQDYTVKKGDSLWSLCYQKFQIPIWLLQETNSDIDISNIKAGDKIKIPLVKEKSPDEQHLNQNKEEFF